MKDLKRFIKKNRYTVLAIILFIILALITFEVKNIFFPDTRSAIYGDRLDGKVEVKQETYDKLKENLQKNEKIKSVTITENGKLVNIVLKVVNDLSLSDAKKLTDNMLEPFTESQVGYYDFQVFVTKEDAKENNFPIIGYKHHNSSSFSWNKDREKTKEDGE